MDDSTNGCKVDSDGYVVTPSGAKAARVHDGCLWLFDKHTRSEVPFTQSELAALFTQTQTKPESTPPTA